MNKYWSVLFAVVCVLCAGLFALAPAAGWWLPKNVSSYGDRVDFLFYLILGITTFFFILTEALLVYAMWFFAHEPGRKAAFIHGNHKLELLWTAIPAGILILIAVLQISTWNDIKLRMPKPNGQTQQMEVYARQWEWRVRYPSPRTIEEWAAEGKDKDAERWGIAPHADDVHAVNEVHVWAKPEGVDPADQYRVLVHLKTRDVLHSFFLPTLRLKQDAVPGKTIPVWFMAEEYNTVPRRVKVKNWVWEVNKDGKSELIEKDVETIRWVDGFNPVKKRSDDPEYVWDLACAEFCGTRHSMMKGKLFVHKDRADFLAWLRSAEKAQNSHDAEKPAAKGDKE